MLDLRRGSFSYERPDLGDQQHGLLEMDERLCEALKRAESRAAAGVTAKVRRRLTEEAAIQAAWDWHIRNRDAEVPFSEIVTWVHACCTGITSARLRDGFERRRRSNSDWQRSQGR